MFEKIRLTNYRTHACSELRMGPITLLIGNNNSGKSNLFSGIRHFSRLVARARPEETDSERESVSTDRALLTRADLFAHRYRLAKKDDPMSFFCKWKGQAGEVEYTMKLLEHEAARGGVGCRETIRLRLRESAQWTDIDSGVEIPVERLLLRTEIENSASLEPSKKKLCQRFFRDMAQAFSYHFQPSFLKGKVPRSEPWISKGSIPSQLGYEGQNLQKILLRADSLDERAYQRFLAAIRRFEPTFHGIRNDSGKDRIVWEFDLKQQKAGRLEEFSSDAISDGLIKAAAVALLTTVFHPPALILIEEIENGINPGNINQFINWLWQAAGLPDTDERGYATQVILTSHSPSVLREFSDRLEYVYTIRLDRKGLKSDVRNLRDALDVLIGVGTVDGEIDDEDGTRNIRIPKYELTELWYNGTIG